MPPRWQPPEDLLPHLEYNSDKTQVRCLICRGENVSGLGRWIDRKGLKKHIETVSHKNSVTNRTERAQNERIYQDRIQHVYASAASTLQTAPSISLAPVPRPAMYEEHTSTGGVTSTEIDMAEAAAEYSSVFPLDDGNAYSPEEEKRRISEQFQELFLSALRSDGLDPNDEGPPPDNVDSFLQEDSEERNADIDTDDICEDFDLFASSDYRPYPNKTVMLLDILDNLGRCRFSSTQISLIMMFARELGATDVPSYKGFRKLQAKLRSTCGSTPKKQVSSQGNIFYMNDIRETIARDFANPNVAPHLHLYPEETDGPISETWQANRWKEYDPSQLTPMYSHGLRSFWINELAQLKDSRFVIPSAWIVRNGVLCADVADVSYTPLGWKIEPGKRSVPAEQFEWDYGDVIARIGDSTLQWVEGSNPPQMPNKMRELVDEGEDLYVVMVSPWADDVSGNKSKQYNKHMNMYAGNGCLPGRLLQQEFHVHYVSTSPHASSAEQFSAFRKQINETETKPHKCFNAATQKICRFIIRSPGLPADNPQQSEESSHMGANANHPCRKCKWGGNGAWKESDEGFHTCHFAGIARDAQEIKDLLQKQLRKAMYGVQSHVEQLQTDSGTKDTVTQFWIQQLLEKAKTLQSEKPHLSADEIADILEKWLDEQPGDKYNPLLDIAGLDPSQDTPVELLHTILLGVIKYIWHLLNTSQWSDADRHLLAIRLQSSDLSGLNVPPLKASYMVQYRNNLIGKHFKTLMQVLPFHVHGITTPEQFALIKAAGDLGSRLWVPRIDDMDEYLKDLEVVIANVLDAFDAVDPLRILVKIKLHLLPHIVDDIRRFGPAIRFSTEIYEAYNAIFRLCSIFSNHLSPSRDISYKFSALERVKHTFSGGYFWDSATNRWCQAGAAVLRFLRDQPAFQRHVGWVSSTPAVSPGSIVPISLKQAKPVTWKRTHASVCSSNPLVPNPSKNSTWRFGERMATMNGDIVTVGSWVFAQDQAGRTVIGRIFELLSCIEDDAVTSIKDLTSRRLVTLEQFLISDARHPDFDWPVLRRPSGTDITEQSTSSFLVLDAKTIRFKVSVQHDCRLGQCKPTAIAYEKQEREETDREVHLISHHDDDHFILNLGGLHNFVEICQTLPRALTKPTPLHSDRKAFHLSVSIKAREIRIGKRQKVAEKRKATAIEKKKKAEEAAAAAAAAVAVTEEIELEDECPSDDEDSNGDAAHAIDMEEEDGDTYMLPTRPRKRKRT